MLPCPGQEVVAQTVRRGRPPAWPVRRIGVVRWRGVGGQAVLFQSYGPSPRHAIRSGPSTATFEREQQLPTSSDEARGLACVDRGYPHRE
jgi:hypothetical protein